jgi:urease accessory protein
MMHRASIHSPAGQWPDEESAGTCTLDFDARHRRRFRLTTDQGDDVLLDLPQTIALSDGDGLRLEDGRWLKVQAAPETLVEIKHEDPLQLMRLGWHLGNRHLPTEIRELALRIRPDHVIEDLLRGFGAHLHRIEAAFQPEGGAYGQRHHHKHDEDHHHHD